MSSANVVLCYPVSEKDTEKIRSSFEEYQLIVSSQERVAEDLLKADIFCGHAKVPVDWQKVVASGRLRWIQSSAAGLDHCLTPSVIDSNILVSGCSALFANQVGEHTLALLYGMLRRLPVFFRASQQREFTRRPTDTLRGKTVAVIGLGGNGRRIAELLRGVAGEILATDLFPNFEVPEYVTCFAPDRLDAVLGQSDVVIVTLPLNDSTEQLIGETQFSKMRDGAYFLNVARGNVVDQKALCRALQSGKIGYAGLDVVDPEPLPSDDPLWDLDNVIITPHVGAQAENRVSLTTELFCLNHRRFVARKTLVNEVDKKLRMPRPENRLKISNDGHIVLPKLM